MAKRADPDQTLQNSAPYQGLHCLHNVLFHLQRFICDASLVKVGGLYARQANYFIWFYNVGTEVEDLVSVTPFHHYPTHHSGIVFTTDCSK